MTIETRYGRKLIGIVRLLYEFSEVESLYGRVFRRL
jgi:hypothetical protein